METKALLYTASAFIFSLVIILKFLSKSRAKNLPPLVPGWLPVIGHVHRLTNHLHRVLHDFSLKVGPIFSLHLGSKLVVVVSSSALVDECFNKNDVIFANRPVRSLDCRSLGASPIIGAQYGDHWRNMRKRCDLEIFASAKLASFLSIRREEMDYMISGLYKTSATGFMKVNVEEKIVELTFNNIMRMIDGKRYYGEEVEEDEETKNFRRLTKEALELANSDNPGEIFPMLKWIGCNELEKRLALHRKKTDEFMQALLDEHRQGPRGNTVVDHLLNLQESQPDYYTDEIITGLIVTIIIAGTDASVVATEWVMTQLLNHPEAMNKAREEIDSVVGHDRLIEEHDLPKLRYLHYIILETLRLFPSVPLLVPHATSRDCKIGGYDIPKGTMILVNAWAIHRDPKVWDEPLMFKPERFEKIEVETHKLLPFGMGKRACPGAGLAQKYIGLAVGSLIQCFDWKRTSAEKIDVSEGPGFILVKRNTLEGMCKTRGVMENVVRGISRV